MKLITYRQEGSVRIGVAQDGRVVPVETPTAGEGERAMIRLLSAGHTALSEVRAQAALADPGELPLLDEVQLLAPIPQPGKIVAIGRNYADHAAETGIKPFEKPRIIAKLPSSVSAPGSTVHTPPGVQKLDYEIELGVVIGRRAKAVSADAALEYVAGYTILNDVSARELQFDVSPPQTTFAKSMDGFCPMGPWIVTADEIADPQALSLELRVNGEVLQTGSTHDMIFSVAKLIEYITDFVTLEPGDVIATGTPAGVGAFRKPPRWLRPGDRLRLEIDRIGVLEHAIG
jgi:2-keto-4-pentenoate hydratase/2-oxohepta-3-ene-1,7-dioic acid hydratase in catechol pathway